MKKYRTIEGDELTKEEVERLADEAERGYDLAKAKAVYPGRPSLSGAGTSPRIAVRVDPKLARSLRARARREQCSVSDLARRALAEYVARNR